MIEITSKGILNTEYLEYRIIRTDHEIYVYDRNYRGLEIILDENELSVRQNTTILNRYSLKS